MFPSEGPTVFAWVSPPWPLGHLPQIYPRRPPDGPQPPPQ